VATPVDWKQGGSCMVIPSVKPEEIPALFPQGVTVHEVPSGKVSFRQKKIEFSLMNYRTGARLNIDYRIHK
jgi:hypothetical protein